MADSRVMEAKAIIINNYKITLIDEKVYSINSTDNTRSYENEYCRNREYCHASAHGVLVGDVDAPETSAILLGVGGATGIHNRSIAHNKDVIYVAAGDAVFSLKFPSLELLWITKVDFATCFGIYWLEEKSCLISWGEIKVCRLTTNGEITWEASGRDIFTEGFELKKEHVEVTDFYNDIYKIDIGTGDIEQIKS